MGQTAPDFDPDRLDFDDAPDADLDDGPRLRPPVTGFAIGERLALARARAAHTFEREMAARRGFLWVPVAFGAGILGYFALPAEPSAVALVLLTAALALAAWRNRFRVAVLRTLIVLTAVVAGTAAAKLRTDIVASPMLGREVTATVVGWISGLDEAADGGRRVYIRVDHMERFTGAAPRTVRVTIRKGENLWVGEPVSVLAGLAPPSGPSEPGAYDFAAAAFYEGIGAYGFSYGAAKPAKLGAPPLDILLSEPVASLREAIRQRVEAAVSGENGHVAAALIMGDQNGISDKTQNDMRASGLGHILSISGLHLAMVAGSVFWILRALFALSPGLALRRPIKQWAAAGALAVSAAYLAISGGGVATVRSFLMLAIVLGAVMIGRRALTLRNVAVAALAVLIFTPESVLSVSFQMSFAATAALVAAYETIADRAPRPRLAAAGWGLLDRLKRDAGALILTSFVAGLATTPFAAYQFQRLAPLTLVANIAAAPAVGLIVMPMALLAAVLMPFGLEVFPLKAMAWGLGWMEAVAAKTAEWSTGYGSVSMPSATSLMVAVAGFLWVILWREHWRWAGAIPIILALPLAAMTPRPDLIVNADGSAAAVRAADGRLRILGSDDFTAGNWLRADGDSRGPDDASLRDGVACDRLGCVAKDAGGAQVSLVLKPEAFAEDCRRAAIVLSGSAAPKDCAARALVIDQMALAAGGARALFATGTGYRVEAAYPLIRRPFMLPAGK